MEVGLLFALFMVMAVDLPSGVDTSSCTCTCQGANDMDPNGISRGRPTRPVIRTPSPPPIVRPPIVRPPVVIIRTPRPPGPVVVPPTPKKRTPSPPTGDYTGTEKPAERMTAKEKVDMALSVSQLVTGIVGSGFDGIRTYYDKRRYEALHGGKPEEVARLDADRKLLKFLEEDYDNGVALEKNCGKECRNMYTDRYDKDECYETCNKPLQEKCWAVCRRITQYKTGDTHCNYQCRKSETYIIPYKQS